MTAAYRIQRPKPDLRFRWACAALVAFVGIAACCAGGGCAPVPNDPCLMGDERVCWDPVPDEDVAHYEVRNQWGAAIVVGATETCLTVAATSLVVIPRERMLDADLDARVAVRACDAGGLCSRRPSNVVRLQSWACLRAPGCEEPCYAGAPRRFEHLPEC